ncbi:alanine dehydrogenase, partial [Vibrio parahaemolyticus]|nr:alanine dehydrogenase [Vibrio parahaemolyticus]
HGGRGLLLGGVPGVEPAKVVIGGGGVVGALAARMAVGLRADVTSLDRNVDTLRQLDEEFEGQSTVIYSTEDAIEKHVL